MARTPLYSRSPQRPAMPAAPGLGTAAATGSGAGRAPSGAAAGDAAPPATGPGGAATEPPAPTSPPRAGLRQRAAAALARHRGPAWALLALAALVAAGWPGWTARLQAPPTLAQLDQALRRSLAEQPLPAQGLAAFEAIAPSVVRVVGELGLPPGHPPVGAARKPRPGAPATDESGRSVGTGVVIVDKGLILTNLHVVAGATRITITFADGSQSAASVVGLQPENDLAVLQAHTLPDDLHAATLRSTAGLAPGEAVMAVGFPFGIGPSASQGVVSGLQREFRSPEGQRVLTNLIQFDAAANPGNSGGPLVTMDGHVVGIVTAILNPNQQGSFVGIGFAVPIENAAAAVGLPPF